MLLIQSNILRKVCLVNKNQTITQFPYSDGLEGTSSEKCVPLKIPYNLHIYKPPCFEYPQLVRSVEHEPSLSLSCSTGEAIIIPQGVSGKTKDILVGCIVPVIQYEDSLVLGHFGPLRTDETRSKLTSKCLSDQTPLSALMYSIDPETTYWIPRKNDYDKWREQMRDTIAEIINQTPDSIELHYYPMVSEVVVDWQKGSHPDIYTQSGSIQ